MKSLISFIFLFNCFSYAESILDCSVPSENQKKITVTLKLQIGNNADYLLVLINDLFPATYLTQTDKGEISKSFESKNFSYFLLSDKSQNNNGVVTNSAYISIENHGGTVAGFLSAKGNIYPLVCAQEH